MILVGQYDSPFVRRVAVTLHHYHMPFSRNTTFVVTDPSSTGAPPAGKTVPDVDCMRISA